MRRYLKDYLPVFSANNVPHFCQPVTGVSFSCHANHVECFLSIKYLKVYLFSRFAKNTLFSRHPDVWKFPCLPSQQKTDILYENPILSCLMAIQGSFLCFLLCKVNFVLFTNRYREGFFAFLLCKVDFALFICQFFESFFAYFLFKD